MVALVISLLIVLLVLLFLIVILLFKPFYKGEFLEDELIQTNGENYAEFKVDEKYKEHVDCYKISKYDDDRFLSIVLKDNVYYYEAAIICYKDKKIAKIILIKNFLKNYSEDFLIKLPSFATSFKLEFLSINEEEFKVNNIYKTKKIKLFLISSLFSLISIIPLFLTYSFIYLGEGNPSFDEWNNVLDVYFNKYYFYIAAITIFALTFIIVLTILLLKNREIKFKLIKNKKNDENNENNNKKAINIYKFLNYKIDYKIDYKDDNKRYFIFKLLKKKQFLEGIINFKAFDKDSNLILTFPYKINKYSRKVKILKTLDFNTLTAKYKILFFKKFIYKNNEISLYEYKNKNGVINEINETKGFLISSFTCFAIFILLFSSFFNASSYLNKIKNSINDYEYEFVDEENKDEGITITSYKGDLNKVYIPKIINNYEVKSISPYAFNRNLNIEEVYFSNDIIIESNAFRECSNLKKVDFNYISEIGSYAFNETSLEHIEINDKTKIIEAGAFSSIKNLKSVSFNSSSLKLGNYILKDSILYGDLYIYKQFLEKPYRAFTSFSYNNAFIYDNEGYITKDNYTNIGLKNNTVYFLSSCIHDKSSFIVKDDVIYKEIDAIEINSFEGTCIERSYKEYECNICSKNFKVLGYLNLDVHNFVDGYCTWCGKKE